MPLDPRYQVVILDAAETGLAAVLSQTVRLRVQDLGLDPNTHLIFPELATLADLHHTLPCVAVFFGGTERVPDLDAAATTLRSQGFFVLPVVPTLVNYRLQVPDSLLEINGTVISPDDPQLEAIAIRLLEELRLLRARRLLFLSYKRTESSGVAEQLYRAFDDRSFDVFLDTHSVRSGLEFQSVLWDQMGDADLLVLLDTPTALSSRWVAQELARASALGLGILQLIWPNHTRTAGTDLADPIYLTVDDFEPALGVLDETARLTQESLHIIATRAEALRAKSLGSRRIRVVADLCTRARSLGYEVDIQPVGRIDLRRPGQATRRVFPVIGHPLSLHIHECADNCDGAHADSILIYDPLGMLVRRLTHLGWLNTYLPVTSRPITDMSEWLATP